VICRNRDRSAQPAGKFFGERYLVIFYLPVQRAAVQAQKACRTRLVPVGVGQRADDHRSFEPAHLCPKANPTRSVVGFDCFYPRVRRFRWNIRRDRHLQFFQTREDLQSYCFCGDETQFVLPARVLTRIATLPELGNVAHPAGSSLRRHFNH
jgi:hypothetical protein